MRGTEKYEVFYQDLKSGAHQSVFALSFYSGGVLPGTEVDIMGVTWFFKEVHS